MEWTQKKSNMPSVMMSLDLEDFASIEVEKKTLKNLSIKQYVINVDVKDVYTESFIIDELSMAEKALKEIKQEIEYLYDEIADMEEDEIRDWCDNFSEIMEEFQ